MPGFFAKVGMMARTVGHAIKSGALITLAETTPVDVTNVTTTIKGAFSDFSVANLLIILTAGISVAAGLFLCWFGYRWLVRRITAALRKGRL